MRVYQQLAIIFIGRNHIHFISFICCLPGHGSNHIIRFVAIHFHNGDVESFYDTFDIRKRIQKIFRRFFAIGFVVGKVRMSFRGGMCIETHSEMRWFFFIDEIEQRIGETELRIRVSTF